MIGYLDAENYVRHRIESVVETPNFSNEEILAGVQSFFGVDPETLTEQELDLLYGARTRARLRVRFA